MKKFLIFYWFNIIILFGLFYWEVSPISQYINPLQTDLTAYLISLTLPFGMMNEHEILINPHYALVIEKACNGIVPYLFLLASVFAFPSSSWHKLKWGVYGYLVIMGVNILRIWLVTQFVLEGKENFSLAHDYIGNALVIATSLLLFVLFVKTRKKGDVESSVKGRTHLNGVGIPA